MRLHISSWRAVQEKLTLQWVPEGCDLVAPAEAVVSLEEFIKDQGDRIASGDLQPRKMENS